MFLGKDLLQCCMLNIVSCGVVSADASVTPLHSFFCFVVHKLFCKDNRRSISKVISMIDHLPYKCIFCYASPGITTPSISLFGFVFNMNI